MKKILILIAILLGLFLIFGDRFTNSGQTFNSTVMPLSLEYPEGYHLEEGPSSITLMLEEDYQSILRGEREGGEGPPAITIQSFPNPSNLSPQAWIEENPGLSNSPLIMGSVTETAVLGRPGISYQADGLYASQNVVFSDESRVYLVSGQYLDKTSSLYRDFRSIVDSIKFN